MGTVANCENRTQRRGITKAKEASKKRGKENFNTSKRKEDEKGANRRSMNNSSDAEMGMAREKGEIDSLARESQGGGKKNRHA